MSISSHQQYHQTNVLDGEGQCGLANDGQCSKDTKPVAQVIAVARSPFRDPNDCDRVAGGINDTHESVRRLSEWFPYQRHLKGRPTLCCADAGTDPRKRKEGRQDKPAQRPGVVDVDAPVADHARAILLGRRLGREDDGLDWLCLETGTVSVVLLVGVVVGGPEILAVRHQRSDIAATALAAATAVVRCRCGRCRHQLREGALLGYGTVGRKGHDVICLGQVAD